MRTIIRLVALMLAMCAWCDLLPASNVSFLQPPLNFGDSLPSESTSQQESDNFSFFVKTYVGSLRWWGSYSTSAAETDHFTIRIFNHQTTGPQTNPSNTYTSLTINRSNSGLVDAFGETIYQYQAQLPSPLVFNASSTSYLSVLNNTTNGWFWQKSGTGQGSNWFRFGDPDPWLPATSGNLAFEMQPYGDYDGNFSVGSSDYNLWRQTFGNTGVLLSDGNANGTVETADYVIWRKNIVKRPGDYDVDSDVDLNDYQLWRRTFGNAGEPLDGSAMGTVDAADYVIWRKYRVPGAGAGLSLAVPEPMLVAIIVPGVLLVALNGNRRLARERNRSLR